ncbi:metal ABC transporter solute-binding protein, Zn/Mn family [Streptomyces sp. NPDC015346]|uniref:metal ABC transporter solute-binding protein, Zn/Mn family n=1 Tax=Streptomyces sp. NPDC015346 TaxID=3364954 RepID=UPI0036FB0039
MRVSSPRRRHLLSGVALLLVCGCGGVTAVETGGAAGTVEAAGTVVPVVASTNVYGDIVERIGGDRVRVDSIISDPAQDPHSYEASSRTQLALSKAKVIVENGGGYDDFVDRMRAAARNTSAEVVDVVEVSGKDPDADEDFNEHLWYDFPTMGRLADRIAGALAEAAPEDADAFRRNAGAFKDELTSLQRDTARIEADHAGAAVAVTEPVPLYLTEACGLRNSTPADFSQAVEEGEEVSPRSLRTTLALFTDRKVEALVYNEQTSGPQTEKVRQAAEDNAIPVVPVTETLPEGEDYIGWMSATIDSLGNALDR